MYFFLLFLKTSTHPSLLFSSLMTYTNSPLITES